MDLRDVRRRVDSPLYVLIAVAAIALAARLALLGERIAHWDEGRVGYDVLRYMATGAWEYRPIVHGPFLPHVNRLVFSAIGADDFTARLVVALVGGLLPLAAWLYRDHLRDAELVALGLFLAADPILLYYSRFMRNDVPVAAFAFVGLGLYLRLVDTGRRRYLYAGTAAWALAFTAKENAILYPVSILGALVLLLDHRLFVARGGDPPWTEVALDRLRRVARGLWRLRLALLVAAVEFLAIVVLFYAPRAGATEGIGLWKAFAQPSMFPAVLEASTVGAAEKIADGWIGSTHQDHAYLPFLGDYLRVLASTSGPMVLLAVLGFVADRYRGERPRDLVALGFYWGVVSVLGYPIAVDIRAAWTVTHAIVPLAIPAAAGAALIYGWGRDALDDGDEIGAALAALVLVLVAAQVAGTAATTSYLNPQGEENVLVQYAQPEGEMRPALRAIERAARANDGLDVLWYGDHLYVADESGADRLPIAGGGWYNRLPLPWYLESYGATVNSTNDSATLDAVMAREGPPVVITCAEPNACPGDLERRQLRNDLPGYRVFRYEGRQFSLDFVFLVDEEYVEPSSPSS